jgi:non-heme chloroperoxidase
MAPALGVPALVLHSSAGPEVSDEDVRDLLSGLPDGELVALPGAGHMLPLTHPEAVADSVARWVEAAGDPAVRGAPDGSTPR